MSTSAYGRFQSKLRQSSLRDANEIPSLARQFVGADQAHYKVQTFD
jgi:hypothetical protein